MFRLIIDPPLDGATNMARDEALLISLCQGDVPPTLRLYQWSPACLSLGRFQRANEINRARCEAEGIQVVRRPSGGRALLHAAELTYALVVGAGSALGNGSITTSYGRISAGLLAGIARLGAQAQLASDERRTTAAHPSIVPPSRRPASAACYDTPVAHELVVDGRKLIGSAQRRHGTAILQHGAIPFVPHADRLCALLHRPPAVLNERMTTLAETLGRDVTFDEVACALLEGCAEAWNVCFAAGTWSKAELVLAETLRAKYANEHWTWGACPHQ